MITAYKGIVVHSLGLGDIQVLEPGAIGVDDEGKIVFVVDLSTTKLEVERYDTLKDLGDHLLIPGFVDGHCHAPQYSYLGIGMHLPLLEWLAKYAFPNEGKCRDLEHAKRVYRNSVRQHLLCGSTTCSYFATVHLEASKVLADIIEECGQRGFVGKVNMDRNAPDFLTETTTQSIEDTKTFVKYCLDKKSPLLTPVITPRFVPSTTSELMHALARISRSRRPHLPIQSHLSENKAEIDWVSSMHPGCDSYTKVYDDHGLLHERTYMAHCIWCSESERRVLHERNTAVIHCPNSNFNLSSGILNVRRMRQEGIKVGLGTDVSGGSSTSMLDAIRQTVIASKLVAAGLGSTADTEHGDSQHYEALSYAEAFHLATVGSAECLGIDQIVGNFIVGKDFDALVVNLHEECTPIHANPEDTALELFQRFLFVGDDRHIDKVYVRGTAVTV